MATVALEGSEGTQPGGYDDQVRAVRVQAGDSRADEHEARLGGHGLLDATVGGTRERVVRYPAKWWGTFSRARPRGPPPSLDEPPNQGTTQSLLAFINPRMIPRIHPQLRQTNQKS